MKLCENIQFIYIRLNLFKNISVLKFGEKK